MPRRRREERGHILTTHEDLEEDCEPIEMVENYVFEGEKEN